MDPKILVAGCAQAFVNGNFRAARYAYEALTSYYAPEAWLTAPDLLEPEGANYPSGYYYNEEFRRAVDLYSNESGPEMVFAFEQFLPAYPYFNDMMNVSNVLSPFDPEPFLRSRFRVTLYQQILFPLSTTFAAVPAQDIEVVFKRRDTTELWVGSVAEATEYIRTGTSSAGSSNWSTTSYLEVRATGP